MPVKDRIVTWFIKNIVVPRQEIIDQPGFIVTTFTEHSTETYLRELLIPEQLFQFIESNIIQTYGEQGKQALYSAGKKFGYLYSSMSNFPTIDKSSTKRILDFVYLLVRYNECMYAQLAEHEVDIENKNFTISFDDYVVCKHNGFGYIMADGGIAGIWAYLMQDKSIEGIQTHCQGRGDQRCKVICAPDQKLNESFHNYFKEMDLPLFKFDLNYKKMNEIRPTKYPSKSFKQLLNAGFFRYNHGILTYNESRFFLCESHILYLLESELSKLINGDQVLFDACFEFGQLLHQRYGHSDFRSFLPDFFSALGFGDIHVFDSNGLCIGANYYPWSILSNDCRYISFRGIMSGFISSATQKEILFTKYEIKTQNFLNIIIKQ